MDTKDKIKQKYDQLKFVLNEKSRRIWAATEAKAIGWGGITRVMEATGLSYSAISHGIKELKVAGTNDEILNNKRIRRSGGGRKKLEEKDATLISDLEKLIDPLTRGDPESPLRWTCKSIHHLAAELHAQGHQIKARKVGYLLNQLGYSLQANRKSNEMRQHPDRNAQFEHINATVEQFQLENQPTISVDTKKKELVGEYKNTGREWQPKRKPVHVQVHDFKDEKLGKAIPYGVYDITNNEGWVNVGIDHDTAEFAVNSIRKWWFKMGKKKFLEVHKLYINADGGGSNGSRSRLWKWELQDLANETRLEIHVSHFPPGTSKWNKIEHRLFCHISQNWRGKPLTDMETIVNLIGNTKTKAGLTVQSDLDENEYPTGKKVTGEEMKLINIEKLDFNGNWNYIIRPNL